MKPYERTTLENDKVRADFDVCPRSQTVQLRLHEKPNGPLKKHVHCERYDLEIPEAVIVGWIEELQGAKG